MNVIRKIVKDSWPSILILYALLAVLISKNFTVYVEKTSSRYIT